MPEFGGSISRLFLMAVLVLLTTTARAGGPMSGPAWVTDEELQILLQSQDVTMGGENERLISSGLAVALGAFGAHRIYIGTTPVIAVLYGITFGGFGVMVLLDLGHILFTKDLAPYRNNGKFFMWGKPKESTTPQ